MVENINPVGSADSLKQTARARRAYGASETARPTQADEVQMSSELKELSKIDGIRLDKVLEVRRALANGTYLTDKKVDKALDSAIDDAFSDVKKS